MTSHRTLIVARMAPADRHEVAGIFADSDAGQLPAMVGVTHRSLFRFGTDLYFHFVEADTEVAPAVEEVRRHPLYDDVNRRLARYVTAYDPVTWRSPADAMAEEFYRWDRTA
jgi:cyclase